MKVAQIFAFVAVACVSTATGKYQCDTSALSAANDQKPEWVSMADPCIDLMKKQVQTELNAAITYLAMGAHFSRDIVNRPGFSKMFFESANEEREHAIKIIEYLLMRGELISGIADLIHNPYPKKSTLNWSSGWEALHAALALETSVTQKINLIIKKCENPSETGENDYHLSDYLTGVFLEEQYKGQRDLAGKLSTLEKMNATYGDLGEYLFDKKLLNGEVPVIA